MKTVIRHWLPIVTFCPVNGLPDFLYASIELDSFAELYSVRRNVRKHLQFKTLYMEDAAKAVQALYPQAVRITVTLWFSRHIVILERSQGNT